jgi:hypothetical protein
MRTRIDHRLMVTVATIVVTTVLPAPSRALTKCSARIRATDGTILVSAAQVAGPLNWGPAGGQETNIFANAATCLKGTAARGCQLGAPGTPEQITPPELCSVFLSDATTSCAAHIHGCTPGVRTAVAGPPGPTGAVGPTGAAGPTGPTPALTYVTCTGAAGTGGGASSSCTAACPAGTNLVSGVCANASNPQVPQFVQGLISDPGTNTTWSCTVRNQNSVGSPGTVAAQGTAICLPQG